MVADRDAVSLNLPLSCFVGGWPASSDSGLDGTDLAESSCGIDFVRLLSVGSAVCSVLCGAASCCWFAAVVSDTAAWDGLGLSSDSEPAMAVTRRSGYYRRWPDQG